MKSNITIGAALAALTIAVFWSVARCDFVNYDDPVFVTQNYHVLGGLTAEGAKWAFTTSQPDYWRPLSWLSHQLDVELFGLKPAGHHLINLLFHIASTLLLFWALRLMTREVWPSAFVAALFAVHPLHVESVAWVAERKDVLNGFFWMLTLVAYAHYAQQPSVRRYFLVLGSFVLGLMSKPMAVTLPCALLLLDLWPLNRVAWNWRTLLRLAGEKAPMLVLAILVSALAVIGQKEVGAMVPVEALSWWGRVSTALVAYAEYLRKTVWPVDLAVFYPHPGTWPMGRVALACAFLAVVTAAVAFRWRKHPFLAVGWLWYLGTLLPAIGLVQVGSQGMADRYTYIPLIGVFIMLAWTARQLIGQYPSWFKPKAIAIAGALVVVASGAAAMRQVGYWRNSYVLFEHALAVAADNSLARMQFAAALSERGRFEEAEQHLARAVALSPLNEHVRCNYAMALCQRGKFPAALEQLTEALRVRPNYAPAHFQMAVALAATGRPAEAVAAYREAVRYKPDFLEALNNLAWMLATHREDRIRNGTEAVTLAERACAISGWQTPSFIGTLAASYAEAGRFADAVNAGEKARALAAAGGNEALAQQNAAMIELYRANRPFRETQ